MKHFKDLIYKSKTIVRTDHSNLKFLESSSLQRCQRWYLLLADFDIKIEYIPGKKNNCADFLSREGGEEIRGVLNFIDERIESDEDLKQKVTKLHSRLNHPGIQKLTATLSPHTDLPSLRNIVEQEVRSCEYCQKEKLQNKPVGKLKGSILAPTSFSFVSLDICGPFIKDQLDGEDRPYKFSVLTILDIGSKWVELVLLTDTTAKTVTKEFKTKWLCRYPIPNKIITDNGVQFLSNEFRKLLSEHCISHTTTMSYNPRGNSHVERIHRELNSGLRIYRNEPVELALAYIADGMRKTFNRSIDTSPNNLVFSRDAFRPEKLLDSKKLEEQRKTTQKNQQKKDQERLNKDRRDIPLLGRRILLRSLEQDKYSSPWIGPLKVFEEKLDRSAVLVGNDEYSQWVPIRRTKLFEEGEMSCQKSDN